MIFSWVCLGVALLFGFNNSWDKLMVARLKKPFSLLISFAILLVGNLLSSNHSAYASVDNSYESGSSVYLNGSYVQVGIASNGRFGTGDSVPSGTTGVTWHPSGGRGSIGFVADRNRDNTWLDTDFFTPGTPQEGWGIDISGRTSRFDYYHSDTATQSFGDVNLTTNEMYVVHTTVIGNIKIEQRYSVPRGTGVFNGDQNLNVQVTITNIGGGTETDINYLRNVDPDNLQDVTGNYDTTNTIVSQYGVNSKGYSLVSATNPDTRQTPAGTSYVGLFSTDSRSSVSEAAFGVPIPVTQVADTSAYGWFGNPEIDGPFPYLGLGYNNTTVGLSRNHDAGISILFRLGSLSAGQSTRFNFSYVLSATSAADLVASAPVIPKVIPASYLTFAQNGADNNSYPQSEVQGDTQPLWKNVLTRAGYTFTGWNTKADGSGTAYADQASFKFDQDYVTLYAQWKLIQTAPTLSWATPAAIQAGTALSATQLNALLSVPGLCTYSPAATTVLPVGKNTLSVTCVPTDPKYSTVSTSVVVEVLAPATVTWPAPASIQEGTPLGSAQLNATASVPGSFVYETKEGTLLTAGKSTLRTTFTPTDTRLSPVTAEVTIEVTAKPVIIPEAPASPSYSLTGDQKSTVTWGAGKNAATYTVQVDGSNACSVAALTCDIAQLLGPSNVVTVTSVASNSKTSAPVTASYIPPAAPISLAVVNFDSAKSTIKSSEETKLDAFAAHVKAAGFTTVTVQGHTDSVGGVDNQKLSLARANATITYLKKLLPNVSFAITGFADTKPVADNSTEAGKAANRRVEIFIP